MRRVLTSVARHVSVCSISVICSATPSLAQTPALSHSLGGGGVAPIAWWRIALTLLLCLTLAVGAALLLKWKRHGSLSLNGLNFGTVKHQRIRLLETCRLGNRTDLTLIDCDGERLLVAVNPQGTTLVCHLPPTLPLAETTPS